MSLLLGPVLALLILFGLDLDPQRPTVTACLAVAAWMAAWWITEAVPLAVTALIPVVLFPLLGIANGKQVSSAYFNHIIFLFIGGFLLAIAMQRWQLHKRIALRILLVFGHSAVGLMIGFMVATAFLSMWISNTATAMLMTPVALAVILNLEADHGADDTRPFTLGILISIAYSASIGGMATLIGTPPNLSFARILHISFPGAPDISFASWFMFALPLCLVLLAATALVLHLMFTRKLRFDLDHAVFEQEYAALGAITREEKVVLAAFLAMAVLWMFRAPIDLGVATIPGWSSAFANPGFFNDGTVAIAVAALLFAVPTSDGKARVLDVSAIAELPWHIVLLFGGGFALATGFVESGLSAHLANSMGSLSSVPVFFMVGAIALLITFMTELTSNTATTEMFLPVLAALAVAIQVNPLVLMIPATLAASCAFMLPVATPPNAIIFGTNRVSVAEMAGTGIYINLLGTLFIVIACYYWAPVVFGFSMEHMPEWASSLSGTPR